MAEARAVRSLFKRFLIGVASLVGVVLVCVFSAQLSVNQMFRGIAASRSSGLAGWNIFPSFRSAGDSENPAISRSAEVHSRTTDFDSSVTRLYHLVETHHGYFEDLRTENRSGEGRALAASFAVPAAELDATIEDVKSLGRVLQISVASEDSTVKASRAKREVDATKNNLERLQSLRKDRSGIQDALALQKEIAKATQELAQAENEQQNLLSTVSRAAVKLALIEEHKASLNTDLPGAYLQLRNSLVQGVEGIITTLTGFLAAVLEYGLPVGFWGLLLLYPVRFAWYKFRPVKTGASQNA